MSCISILYLDFGENVTIYFVCPHWCGNTRFQQGFSEEISSLSPLTIHAGGLQ